MKSRAWFHLIVLCAWLVPGMTSLSAQIPVLYVTPTGTSSYCTGWADACTLEQALGIVVSSQEIWVASGHHYPTTTGDRSATFQLKSGVVIYGGFAGWETSRDQRDWVRNETVLSGDLSKPGERGDNSYHVVTSNSLVDGTAVLDGFLIIDGQADGTDTNCLGGGLYNDGGSPTIRNILKFANNYAACFGGGMYNGPGSKPTLENVAFSGNTAGEGGGGMHNDGGGATLTRIVFSSDRSGTYGGCIYNTGNLDISHALLSGCESNEGGAIYNEGGTITLDSSTVEHGYVVDNGGGLVNYGGGGIVTIRRSTFHDNAADGHAGGIWNSDTLIVENSTLSGNQALLHGGGLVVAPPSDAYFYNVTITGNVADADGNGSGDGGGVFSGGGVINIWNSILAGNEDRSGTTMHPDCSSGSAGFPVAFYNLVGDDTGCEGLFPPGNRNLVGDSTSPLDPMLAELDDYGGETLTHALQWTSPARDGGDPNGCLDHTQAVFGEDQRGTPRHRDSDGDGSRVCDMGAFEAGLGHDAWTRALPIPLTPAGDVHLGQASEYLDVPGQSLWYKFQVYPGSRVTVQMTPANANLDLTLYQDIQAAYDLLTAPADKEDLLELTAEFAQDAFSPDSYAADSFSSDAYAPMAYSPMAYSPMAYSPMAYSPMAYSPMAYSPMAYSPMAYSPMAYSPMAYSPMAYSPMAYSPDDYEADAAYSAAQMLSLVGVSAFDGLASERISVSTWDNTGQFYLRVRGRNGAFDSSAPFVLDVVQEVSVCQGVSLIARPSPPGVAPGSYETLILTDWQRMGLEPQVLAELQTALEGFAVQVHGAVVDVGQDMLVDQANAQADSLFECPFAKNQVARLIKDHVNAYRAVNPDLAYVVIVGNDDVIPFYRHPDRALLANEKNYKPPVFNTTASHASLALSYVLSQDYYGSKVQLALNNTILPIPQLAVGRLVETPQDITNLLQAYAAAYDPASDEAVVYPGSSLVTGYDFLEDAALAIQGELEAWLGVPADTIIDPASRSPLDEASWTADELRDHLFAGHDVIFLAGHFSASGTLAADFQTRLYAWELAGSDVDLQNALVFSAGCHSGYNIVDWHGIPYMTVEPDWAGAFARKGATFVGGTGYQYGDTDFIEYGERLYLEFARRLRCGAQPVSIGQALVEAKQDYLAALAQTRGIHEKSLLEATLYGLPMLKMHGTGPAGCPSVGPSEVPGTVAYTEKPGQILGLEYYDLPLNFDLEKQTVTLKSVDPEHPDISASYFSGPDGVVANPVEPVLPLDRRNVSVVDKVLRGVGLLAAGYQDLPEEIPLTGAAATELRGVHAPFLTDSFFPIQPWRANYLSALADPTGATYLALTPAQYVSAGSDLWQGTWRRFDNMTVRLFYSANTTTYAAGAVPALAAPPSIVKVLSSSDGVDVTFKAIVLGDPAAGIQEVWVTYTSCDGSTGCSGSWQSAYLTQNSEDSRLWEGTVSLGGIPAGNIRFIVQAVNGVGLVGMADNMGEYFSVGIDPADPSAGDPLYPPTATHLDLLSPPGSGAYSTEVAFSARLASSEGDLPVAGQKVRFTLGSQQRWATTGADGVATVSIPLLGTPGSHELRVTYPGNSAYARSHAASAFSIGKQGTLLAVEVPAQTVQYSDESFVTAGLEDVDGRPMREKTVLYLLSGVENEYARAQITDLESKAPLGRVAWPAGSYEVTANFGDMVEYGGVGIDLRDVNYSAATPAVGMLAVEPEQATVTYTGDTAPAGAIVNLAAFVEQEADGTPGDLGLARVQYQVRDGDGAVVRSVLSAVDSTGSALPASIFLAAGTYQLEATVTGGYFASAVPASVPIDVAHVGPAVGAISAPPDLVPAGTNVAFEATFANSDSYNPHVAIWDWGDGTLCDTSIDVECTVEDPSDTEAGMVSGSHTYSQAGVYTVRLNVTDRLGGMGESAYEFVVVYDASAGFVTGGGWIQSPPGACPDFCGDATGRANFGFVSRYQKGASEPTGQTEFQFKAGNLNFHSDYYEWLVVAHHKAMYKGEGTINGEGNYGFLLSAIDAELTPSTDVDLFRIKIWDRDLDAVIYDNQAACPDGGDDADPCTELGGGDIVIHRGEN